jgi:hypothetical protein
MRRALRLTIVLGVALFTFVACFSKPDAPNAQGTTHDGGVDAKVIDAPDAKIFMDAPDAKVFMDAPGCSIATDDFSNTTLPPCGDWGTANTVAGTQYFRSSGSLLLNAAMGKTATCSTNNPFHFVNGTTIKLQGVANAGITFFTVRFSNGQSTRFSVTPSMPNTTLGISCNGANDTSPPTPTVPAYVKLSANSTFQVVTVSFSSDNMNWTASALNCGITAPSDDLVNVDIGVTGGSGTGSAYFDDFNTSDCPPPP